MERGSFNAYIDESGDEGFRRVGEHSAGASSEWLILAGVLMFEEQDQVRTGVIDRLRQDLGKPPPKPLHWRDLRRQSQKRAVAGALAQESLIFSAVALWKPGLGSDGAPGLHKKGQLYHYASRLLIERLSWFAHRSGRKLNLLFEDRATTSYEDLRGYVSAIQADPDCTIEPDTLADVRPVSPTRKGAQISDFYAGAVQDALEVDAAGFSSPEYLLALRHQLFRRPPRSVFKDGFKVFPDRVLDEKRYPWLGGL
jgi:hypothetical protein